jgi:hypothetical protein
MTGMICKVCLEREGIYSEAVMEHKCTNERTGKRFSAHVCERCLEKGRETRVTCRTFIEMRGARKQQLVPDSNEEADFMCSI